MRLLGSSRIRILIQEPESAVRVVDIAYDIDKGRDVSINPILGVSEIPSLIRALSSYNFLEMLWAVTFELLIDNIRHRLSTTDVEESLLKKLVTIIIRFGRKTLLLSE
jgi:hypothetical protein